MSGIRIGVSSCLLGNAVRFDGGHTRSPFVAEQLGRWFEFVAICPEVAVGLGTPRQPLRLVAREGDIAAVGSRDGNLDVTEALRDYGRRTAELLGGISGYIACKGLPSCGMERVRVYDENRVPNGRGRGLYLAELMAALPLLPVEEDGRLLDPVLCENFVERVFVYHRWQQLCASGMTARGLVAFHTAHKMLILSRDEQAYRRLGRLVAEAGRHDPGELAAAYIKSLMEVLKRTATRRRHANVLQHLAGYLKRSTSSEDRKELSATIDAYRRGEMPLIAPIVLLRHHLRQHPDPYVSRQAYLNPYPEDLGLRSYV